MQYFRFMHAEMVRLSNAWSLLIITIACVALTVSGDGECKSAKQAIATVNYFSAVTDEDVYTAPKRVSPSGVCKSATSCCSSKAEKLLRWNVLQNFQKTLHDHTNFGSCNSLKSSSQTSSINYIINWRNEAINSFEGSDHIFDSFTNYMIKGIRSLHLPDLEEHINDLLFTVYHFSLKIALGNEMPNTTIFKKCLKEKFFTQQGSENANQHLSFQLKPSMNFLFQFLSALETSDRVVERISSHVLSSECGDALLRMTHCEACSGTTANLPPCTPFCQNVLRGCLVDLTEIGDALSEYATALEAMKRRLDHLNPWQAFEKILQTLVQVSKVGTEAAKGWPEISKVCDAAYISRQTNRQIEERAVMDSTLFEPLSTQAPTALNHAVSCAKNFSQFVQNLPDIFCRSVTNNTYHNCWNGTSIGSYFKAVQPSNRSSQSKNSEFQMLSQSSIYKDNLVQLNSISMELTHCANQTLRECNIELPSDIAPTLMTSSIAKSSIAPKTIEETPKQTNTVQPNDPFAANMIASILIASVFMTVMSLLSLCYIYHKLYRLRKKRYGIYDKIPKTKNSHLLPQQAPPKLPPRRISLCANPAYFHFDPEDASKIALSDCVAYETTVAVSSNSWNGISAANSSSTLITQSLMSTPSIETSCTCISSESNLKDTPETSVMQTRFESCCEHNSKISTKIKLKSCQKQSDGHLTVHHGIYCLQNKPDLCKCSCTVDYLHTQLKETTV